MWHLGIKLLYCLTSNIFSYFQILIKGHFDINFSRMTPVSYQSKEGFLISDAVHIYRLVQRQCMSLIFTVDPRLTDGSTYRLFELQTSLAAKFRFDLQPENQPTDRAKKTKQNGTKTAGYGLIVFQCIVSQWRLDLQTFRPAATVPILINSESRGSTVRFSPCLYFAKEI